MSTRATYGFERDGIKTVFYVHCDGYPEGAAVKFGDSLGRPEGEGFAESFMRANVGAEFTESHEIHGDTEYRYQVKEKWERNESFGAVQVLEITATKRGGDWKYPTWNEFFKGSVLDFVAKYSK